MAHWANYNGHLFVPHVVGQFEEVVWIVKVDGREIRCSSEDVAQKDVAYYQREGHEASYEKRVTTLNIVEDY